MAQNGFKPLTNETLSSSFIVAADGSFVHVSGHWEALDQHSKLSGPCVSEIFCDYGEHFCDEEHAIVVVNGDTFGLSVGHVRYKIIRWTPTEIVAENVAGLCRLRSVLKIDLSQKRVYDMVELDEPIEGMSQDRKRLCSDMAGVFSTAMYHELRDNTVWRK